MTEELCHQEGQPALGVLLPCKGRCPGARTSGVITCEGACSALTMRWLAGRLAREERDLRPRRARWIHSAMFSLAVAAALLGCSRRAPAAPERSAASYAINVTDPKPVKAGAKAAALIRVVPRGPYKINVEFPLKLKASGPPAASPRELLLTKKQAAKLTKAELVLKPEFTIAGAGRHAFKGTLRFSVCTDAQCEIKTENVAWTAVTR